MLEDNSFLVAQALNLWSNYIETGNMNISKKDALRDSKPINELSASQAALVDNLKIRSHKALNRGELWSPNV